MERNRINILGQKPFIITIYFVSFKLNLQYDSMLMQHIFTRTLGFLVNREATIYQLFVQKK